MEQISTVFWFLPRVATHGISNFVSVLNLKNDCPAWISYARWWLQVFLFSILGTIQFDEHFWNLVKCLLFWQCLYLIRHVFTTSRPEVTWRNLPVTCTPYLMIQFIVLYINAKHEVITLPDQNVPNQKEQLNDNYRPNTMVSKRSLGTKEILVPGTVRWPEFFGGGDGICRMWRPQWWNKKKIDQWTKHILVEGGMDNLPCFFLVGQKPPCSFRKHLRFWFF